MIKNIWQAAKPYLQISVREKCFMVLFLIGTLACFCQYYFNQDVLHFMPLQHQQLMYWIVALVLVAYYMIGVAAAHINFNRLGLFMQVTVKNIALRVLCYYTAIFLLTTPFPDADKLLQSMDNAIGYHTLPVMQWVAQYPWLREMFHAIYWTWAPQLFFISVLWALMNRKDVLERFYLSWMITLIIGGVIYYVLPASGPATIMKSPLFSVDDYAFFKQFFDVHHHIKMAIFSTGVITIPSFHVIAAILIVYHAKGDKFLFYPLLLLNILMALSTLALGKHYLVDVIAAFIVAPLAIYLSNGCGVRFFKSS